MSKQTRDLTTGSISRHLLKTMGFMLVTMVFQTLYFLIDLYWVGRLGTDAVAGVGIAGNWTFIVLALTQMLGVGTTAVVSHAIGRKDHAEAHLVFNQSQVLAILTGLVFFIVAMLVRMPYVRAMGADPGTAQAAASYLLWFIPAMSLQFLLVAMGAALRGGGNFKPGMLVSTGSVILNMVMAPFLIFGWVTHRPFGVAGAAISTLVAVGFAVIWIATYFGPSAPDLRIEFSKWKPQFAIWKRILAIGLPTGFEFVMTAVHIIIVYAVTRPFGASAQAAFGIGQRIVQSGFMPVVALGFAVAPVAGQNYGARLADRVRATVKDAALMAAVVSVAFGIVCFALPAPLIDIFTNDPKVIVYGTEYLRILAFSFIASGMIFVSSSMFQAMGNTMPSLISSGIRVIITAIPVLWLSTRPGFQIHWIWYIGVTTVFIQMAISLLLLRREMNRRLNFAIAS